MNPIRTIINGGTMLAIRAGVPFMPPYTRGNAIIVETVGRRSGKRRRTPVGYVADEGRLIVVAEHGERADYVRNALARGGELRVFHGGRWKDARLRLLEADPEPYLRRMAKAHAAIVRRMGTALRAIEITTE